MQNQRDKKKEEQSRQNKCFRKAKQIILREVPALELHVCVPLIRVRTKRQQEPRNAQSSEGGNGSTLVFFGEGVNLLVVRCIANTTDGVRDVQ